MNENLHKWSRNTTLIVGDSTLSGTDERRISKRDRKVKVKNFPGVIIDDMYDYIKSLLKKCPNNIILNVVTNNTINESIKSKKNPNRIIIAHLNINSIRNKFEMLKEVIGNKVDILLISETKLDDAFPLSQFILEGFTPKYRLDRTEHDGGLMLFIREDIPSKLLPNVNPSGNQFRIKNWLISGSYNPNVGLVQNHTVNLRWLAWLI